MIVRMVSLALEPVQYGTVSGQGRVLKDDRLQTNSRKDASSVYHGWYLDGDMLVGSAPFVPLYVSVKSPHSLSTTAYVTLTDSVVFGFTSSAQDVTHCKHFKIVDGEGYCELSQERFATNDCRHGACPFHEYNRFLGGACVVKKSPVPERQEKYAWIVFEQLKKEEG